MMPTGSVEVFSSSLYMYSVAHAVLARFVESAPVTAPYLQKLIAFMEAENTSETSEWRGGWTSTIRRTQSWLKQIAANDVYDVPKTVGEMFQWFEGWSGLEPPQVAELKDVAMPRAPKSKPEASFYDARRELEKVTGKNVTYEGSLEHRKDAPELIALWSRAFKKLKAPAKRAMGVVSKILLANKARGSEDASWDGQGTMRLVLREGHVPSIDVLATYITHELGHGVEERHHVDLNAPPWGQPPFISDYAESKPNIEDFAESFASYALEPGHLKAKAPDKFTALKALRL